MTTAERIEITSKTYRKRPRLRKVADGLLDRFDMPRGVVTEIVLDRACETVAFTVQVLDERGRTTQDGAKINEAVVTYSMV